MRGHWVGLVALFGVSCSDSASRKPQLVVVIDTNAPLVAELDAHPEISADAAIDTLRIDALDGSGNLYASQLFPAADPAEWPFSFGVLPPASGGDITLRLRAFRGLLAQPGTVMNGVSTLDPPSQVTIERLVVVASPTSFTTLAVLLTEDCLGTSSTFLGTQTTCIDASHLKADPRGGTTPADGAASQPSRHGTWPDAFEKKTSASAKTGRIAIPGGFSILGDQRAVGFGASSGVTPVPLRPVLLSPFFLDGTEVTVGHFRQLVQEGKYPSTMSMPILPTKGDPSSSLCTWLGPTDSSNDLLPLNCIPHALAQAVCRLDGGDLPTEAQWEHAARGRGQRRLYPWGGADPTCCALSAGRTGGLVTQNECPGMGPEPVGSHKPGATCAIGDVSRDGVVDMAGSVAEALRDDLLPYDGACWSAAGILHDPLCKGGASSAPSERGTSWSAGLSQAVVAARELFSAGDMTAGFRCAYADGAQ